MATPNLAVAIREAQVQVHTAGSHGSLQGDDLQLPFQHRGLALAGAGKTGPAQIAHHTEHKAISLLGAGPLFQGMPDVGTRLQVQGQRSHQRLRRRANGRPTGLTSGAHQL